jgi:hypothetical protein
MYFLVDCADSQLTCSMTQDFDDIYEEDVVEVFLWPDESQQLYFEYEVSPLEIELPILVPNSDGEFHGWRPWHFTGGRRTAAKTSVRGGPKESMARVDGWTAEFFIPFELLKGLGNVPPERGTRWRANIYRIDYDHLPQSHWAWCPDTDAEFHSFRDFGTFEFA